MKFYIVIPAHNEEDSIALTLESLASQTLLPTKVVVINDNSTDKTQTIVEGFAKKYNWVTLVSNTSSDLHLPGSKIINAFYKGYDVLDDAYDIICKFDADLIFPNNYLEILSLKFKENKTLGMVAGHCYIEKNGEWHLENLTNRDHIRGALKAYRKACFLQIGKLKPSMGWDTVDELLAKYYNWKILTLEELKVKHLKPTGKSYNKSSKHLQGEAMYKLRNGIVITIISALKMALKKKKISEFTQQISGYYRAKANKVQPLVNKDQGRFIRRLRWKGMLSKLF